MTDRRRKLTDEQLETIRLLYKARTPAYLIAEHFGVSKGIISYHTSHLELEKFTVPEVLEVLEARAA